jgi:hypothetical protein
MGEEAIRFGAELGGAELLEKGEVIDDVVAKAPISARMRATRG